MRQVIFVGSPEGSSEESLARMDAAIAQIREAADALRAVLAEDRLNEMQAITASDYLPPKRDEPTEEYELWGVLTGGFGGNSEVHQTTPDEPCPPGLALYVKVGEKK